MIDKIRKRLVLGYTFAIIIIMFMTFVTGYLMLEHAIISTCKKSLLSYMSEETAEALPVLNQWQQNKDIPANISTIVANQKAFNNVVYWFAPDGRLLFAQELPEPMSKETRNIIKNWQGRTNKIVKHSLSAHNNDRPWQFLMLYRDIYEGETFIGRIFVGTNLSPLITISHKYYFRAFIIMLIFSVLAFLIGNKLADKAVQPALLSMKKQKEFIADASHELRTPMSVLLSSVDILKKDYKNNKLISDMKDEILNMRRLVNDLLTIARSENEKFEMVFNNFNLSETIESVTRSLQPIAKEKNISIKSKMEKCIPIYADEGKIRQLFYILLDNAIKYSPLNTVVEIDTVRLNNQIIIAIKDEGLGINKDDQENIFERFYRVDQSRSRSIGGFGLGLPIAKLIVERHDGIISLKSELKKGSTFTINLPQKD